VATGAARDVVASLTRSEIECDQALDPAIDGQPPILLEEFTAVDEIVKADPLSPKNTTLPAGSYNDPFVFHSQLCFREVSENARPEKYDRHQYQRHNLPRPKGRGVPGMKDHDNDSHDSKKDESYSDAHVSRNLV